MTLKKLTINNCENNSTIKWYQSFYSLKNHHLIIVSLLFLNLINLYSQTFPNSPEPWREEYNISLLGFAFQHPMTVINNTEAEIIKYRIENKIEPQFSAFQNLLLESQTQLNFVADPPETMNIMGGYEPNSNLNEMREWLWRNCHAAYTCGLAYLYSGDILYAEKAKEILMDWANKGTIFTGQDRGLQLGSWFSPMLYSADLILNYEGWTESEKAKFKAWWKKIAYLMVMYWMLCAEKIIIGKMLVCLGYFLQQWFLKIHFF